MSVVRVEKGTGLLLVDGRRTFLILVSKGPPPGSKAPSGKDGLAEIAGAGVTMMRTGIGDWSQAGLTSQIAAERRLLDAAAAAGLKCWPWLGQVPNFAGSAAATNEQLLVKIVNALKAHPGLGAWKGFDEPRNPLRGANFIRPEGLVKAFTRLKALDPNHPVVIIQAPRGAAADLKPYRPAFDITGADIYPIAYPPGKHAARANNDISLVGDIAKTMIIAAVGKPVWMTLQIAWSGILPTKTSPGIVPRFPTLKEERFMAYQAIANGARGVNFFGGHLTQVATPADAAAGWNWTFWERALKPVVTELSSTAVNPALVAPDAKTQVRADASDVEAITRQDSRFAYVIAV